MSDIELVIFDLAGTTIRDTGQVPEAFTTALRASGLEITDEEIARVRGASKREAIRRLVERRDPDGADVAARAERLFAEFRERLADIYARDGVQAMPSVEATFGWLRRHGVKIALNTGFDRVITELLLRATGWDAAITRTVVCGDDVTQGRPAPYLIFRAMEAAGATSVHRVASVGDTVLDLQAGRNAGVRWNVGVLSGAHTREQLEQVQPSILLPDVAALPAVLGAQSLGVNTVAMT
jgi:phosphonatase-like hydrolase